MSSIDDSVFAQFVNNLLSQKEMAEVENQLIEDGEIAATLYASVSNYETNMEETHKILGTDDNISGEKDRISEHVDSLSAKEETTLIKNSSIMDLKISKEEVQEIQEILTSLKESEKENLSLNDNLCEFYLSQCIGSYPEEAKKIVANVALGIEKFNENLNNAIRENGIDYVEELKNMGEDFTKEQKYELYINYLASLYTLNVQNLDEEHASQIQNFDNIKQNLSVTGEVTNEMLDELIQKISEALNENTLCLSTLGAMDELRESLIGGTDAIKEVLRDSTMNVQEKLCYSLATYIAYKNDKISSLIGQDVSPEVIAVAVSSGIEQAQVIEDVKTGKTTIDKAITVLKIIGGIALWTTLTLAMAYFSMNLSLFAFGTFVTMLGASTFACIVSAGIALACCIASLSMGGNMVEEILDSTGEVFDSIVSCWRKNVWPVIVDLTNGFIEWISGLFAKDVVIATTEPTLLSTVTAK